MKKTKFETFIENLNIEKICINSCFLSTKLVSLTIGNFCIEITGDRSIYLNKEAILGGKKTYKNIFKFIKDFKKLNE